ncbi:hypothetical protein RQN30_09715 [Arcanobacterium hippocoleae]
MDTLISVRVFPGTRIARRVREIYLEAFPAQERVSSLFLFGSGVLRPNCKLLAWFDSDSKAAPVGFTFDYVYKDVKLLLFLAIDSAQRSGGYGKRILAQVQPPKPGGVVALQLEPLEAGASNAQQRERRWNFYLRSGFRPSPLFSEENGETYATMIRGRDLRKKNLLQRCDY